MIINRKTIRQECHLSGRALHSGEAVTVRILPGSDGIIFRHGSDQFQAIPKNVTDTSRCTVIGTIRTVEHLMSALAALAITDVEIDLTYPEMPGLDGSAAPFYDAIAACGTESIGTKEVEDIFARLYVQADNLKIAVSKGDGHWRYDFVTENRWPSELMFETSNIMQDYRPEIAPARTTVFTEEIEQVRAAGLGQGLDESSVLIIGESGYKNEARFPNEPARHKLLDLIGDLYLSGIPIDKLNVVGYRSGHKRNVEMAKLLFDSCQTP